RRCQSVVSSTVKQFMTFPAGVFTVSQASSPGSVLKAIAHVPDPSHAPSSTTPTPSATIKGSHRNLFLAEAPFLVSWARRRSLCLPSKTGEPEPGLSPAFMSRSGGTEVLCNMDLRRRLALLAVPVVLACAAAVMADDDDHARAKAAREAGEIVSLQAVLDRVQAEFIGSPVEVELDDDDGRWIYKVKLLAQGGAIVRLEYDARDARLRRVKGRGPDAARRQR